MGRLDGKAALITGAASGFGEGIARKFVEEGARVIVADINDDAGAAVADSLGEAARFVHADVSRDADMAAAVAAAVDHFGRLDILVNNAGYTHRNAPMLEVTEDEFDRIYAVNVKSVYLGAIHAVPLFRGQGGGVILNIASTAGVRPRPGLTWYNGSKGAMITLTKSMAVELAPDAIRVCALNPVAGETGMLHLFMGEDTPERRAQFQSTIPLGRFSQPRDIANAALFLCSGEAEFLTGVCLEVDGGRCI
ncbi:MAG: SDR family oxidoreductase [Alphaproteobacteria bacterium]|jgi:3-oxoacyl-[acyl-carrier protein] reductase|nr:SDR family oxidoreductase [Alphaproteobacteria bacterium]